MKQFRQGDLFIQEIEQLPEGLKAQKNLILVYGEATGHKHQLKSGQVFTDDKGLMFLKLSKVTELIHEEHATIDLPKGNYVVIRQREYQSKDMVRLVVD